MFKNKSKSRFLASLERKNSKTHKIWLHSACLSLSRSLGTGAEGCVPPFRTGLNSVLSPCPPGMAVRVTNHPSLPGTVPVLKLKVRCPGNPLVPGKPGQLVTLQGLKHCLPSLPVSHWSPSTLHYRISGFCRMAGVLSQGL